MRRSLAPVRRTALQTRKWLQRTTALPRRRARPRRIAGEYHSQGIPPGVRRAVDERSAGFCEIRLEGICAGVATDRHHRRRRRETGHTIAGIVAACRPCHDWITNNPAEARRMHWIVSIFEDPANVRVPITMHEGSRRWVLLLEDGTYSDGELA